MEETQIVYVLANSAMPELLKIGKTTQSDVKVRMNQLYTTGVPVPFECIFAVEVEDSSQVESALHTAFASSRVNQNREFFKIEAEQAIAVLKLLGEKEVTPQLNQELNKNIPQVEKDAAKNLKRRPNINFYEMGIPKGSILNFIHGDQFAEVVNETKVSFNNQILSLTAATRQALNRKGPPGKNWLFEGKLLRTIHRETYD